MQEMQGCHSTPVRNFLRPGNHMPAKRTKQSSTRTRQKILAENDYAPMPDEIITKVRETVAGLS